jgi:hypothetical protein
MQDYRKPSLALFVIGCQFIHRAAAGTIMKNISSLAVQAFKLDFWALTAERTTSHINCGAVVICEKLHLAAGKFEIDRTL